MTRKRKINNKMIKSVTILLKQNLKRKDKKWRET